MGQSPSPPDTAATPSLRCIADGVWIDTAPVEFLGMRLTANMTVLRLPDGGLLLHSPVACTPGRRAAVDALGSVTHLYSPNTFHHLRIGDWAAAHPTARLSAPAGLAAKRPDLRIDRRHGAPEPAFGGAVEELRIEGFRLEEAVLVYRPARVAIVADLLHNIGRPEHAWTRIYTTLAGFHDRVALSRVIRWTAFPDRKAARRSLDRVLAEDFDTLILGHGEPILTGGKAALIEAYRWLKG